MLIVPRMLLRIVAPLRRRRLQRRLQAQGDGTRDQTRTFRWLLARMSGTEFGRTQGIDAKMAYDRFRTTVRLRHPADFAPLAERMAAGEADVLWPGTCRTFVYTAGTEEIGPRMLPATDDLLRHYRGTLLTTWLLLAARVGRDDLITGPHLQAGASTALTTTGGARAGFLAGIARLGLSSWAQHHLLAPPPEISDLPEGAAKTERTIAANATPTARTLVGSPSALLALLQAARSSAGEGQPFWTALAGCIHTGGPAGIVTRTLAQAVGPGVVLHELYAAAQGIFAVQDGEASTGLRLLTDAHVFFEFLPVQDAAKVDLAHLGDRCVPLAHTRPGVEYLLVVTTPAGLCRCVMGDTVRLTSLHPPRLLVTGRAESLLNTFGELTTERDVGDALEAICQANSWEAVDFHVAPYFSRPAPHVAGCHEWWIELRPGTVRTPTGPILADELDQHLARRNSHYAARRAERAMESPLVRLVMPGTFAQWASLHGATGAGRLRACRNDRRTADQLAGIARFHANTLPPTSTHGRI